MRVTIDSIRNLLDVVEHKLKQPYHITIHGDGSGSLISETDDVFTEWNTESHLYDAIWDFLISELERRKSA